jgi:putative phosphoesterase
MYDESITAIFQVKEYMRVALLSDIHANQDALMPVLESIKELGLNEIIISGDLVGYYYGTPEVLKLLSTFTVYFCKGNHENMLAKSISSNSFEEEVKSTYGSSLIIAQAKLSDSQLEYLIGAPHPLHLNIGNRSLLVSHGSPWNIDEYIYPDADLSIIDRFLKYPEDIFILGNTHYPMRIQIESKLIINPGSVGQSRANFGYADWATLDLSNLESKFYSTKYSTTRLIQECESIDPQCNLLVRHLK